MLIGIIVYISNYIDNDNNYGDNDRIRIIVINNNKSNENNIALNK